MDKMVEDLKIYKGKKVLVTGHTGFKGAWLCYWLHQLGAQVCGFSLEPELDENLFSALKLDELIDSRIGDIRDDKAVDEVFSTFEPEFVFHLAAQALVRPSYTDPKTTFDTNVSGSLNILEGIRKSSTVRSVVYVTTDKCYKNKEWIWGYRENDELGGNDPYSASKAAAEILFHSYKVSFFDSVENLGFSSVRAGNVIGGGDWSVDRIIPDSIKALVNGNPIPVRNPYSTRPWQHVLDPLYGYLKIGSMQYLKPKELSGSWNFGPEADSNRPVSDLVEAVCNYWGSGEVADATEPNPLHEATLLQLNCDKAKITLKWNPVWSFEKSVENTTVWYKKYYDKEDPAQVTREQINSFMGDI